VIHILFFVHLHNNFTNLKLLSSHSEMYVGGRINAVLVL